MAGPMLVFQAGNGVAEIALGAAVDIRIVGGAISAGGPVLAFHLDGAWHVGTQRIERIICKGRVRVEFENKSGRRSFGPFDDLSLTNDVALTGQGILARYRPLEETWYFDRYDSQCEGLVLKAIPDLGAA